MSGTDDTIAANTNASLERAPSARSTLERGQIVGRYVVLSRVGAGGMGVVYSAYDPELDRKVALKLLLAAELGDAQAERRRLMREAQAMARLRHPNVVTVHDVGEHVSRVFLAMEFVEGSTLRVWLEETRRPWATVLAAFVSAGSGLAAAHQQGLVHRDFKPDNVMIGTDGRVQVMDFGLARPTDSDVKSDDDVAEVKPGDDVREPELTRAGSIVGTPAYMAPEQHGGLDVGPAADQFSFCVALWEGLYGQRPFGGTTLAELVANVSDGRRRPPPPGAHVPAWLRRACERGLNAAPEQRFSSMEMLLEALERGHGITRLRRVAIGVGLIASLAIGAEISRRTQRARTVASCESEGSRIAEVWNDDTRSSVRAALLATGVAYADATAQNATRWLDQRADAWRRYRTQACLDAEVDEVWDAPTVDRARWCLDELRLQMQAVVTELDQADTQSAVFAVTAAAQLSPASACTDETTLARMAAPPHADQRAVIGDVQAELARARALCQAGKCRQGLDVARVELQRADAIAWPPLSAAARVTEGDALERVGAYAESEAVISDAYMRAAKAGAWPVAADAATILVFVVGHHRARYAEARLWAGQADVAITLAGDPLQLREAKRMGYLALVETAMGEYADAEGLYEQALAIQREALGPTHPDVAANLVNRALVHHATQDYAKAKTLHEEALAIQEAALGADHPNTAATLNNLGVAMTRLGEHAAAKAMHERALAIRVRVLGGDHPDVAASLNNFAVLHHATGAYAQEKALHEQVLAIREKALGREHPEVAATLANLASSELRLGAPEAAQARCARALAIQEKAFGTDHPDLVLTLLLLAEAQTAAQSYAEGIATLERALAIRRRTVGTEHLQFVDVLFQMGNVEYAAGAYERANDRYEEALAIVEKTLGPAHPHVATGLFNVGDTQWKLGRHDEALTHLVRAVAIFDAHDGQQQNEPATRFTLARFLLETNGERGEAMAQAEQARDGFRAFGGVHAKELAEVEAWLAAHGSAREPRAP